MAVSIQIQSGKEVGLIINTKESYNFWAVISLFILFRFKYIVGLHYNHSIL